MFYHFDSTLFIIQMKVKVSFACIKLDRFIQIA